MERFKDHGRPVDKWDADLLERHADSLARFPDDGDGGEEWFEALIEQVSSAKCALNEVLGGHNGDGDRGAWVDAANNLNDALSGIADLRQRLRGAERKLDTDLQMFRAMGEQRDAAEERERRLRAIASYSGHTQFCVASVGLPCDCGYDAALAALELEREAEDPR